MDIKLKDDIKIVYIDSILYSDNAEKFKEIMDSVIDGKDKKVLLNLKKMKSINSHVMDAILEIYCNLENKGGELVLTNASDDISELFRVTGVEKVVKVLRNEKEGTSYLEKKAVEG